MQKRNHPFGSGTEALLYPLLVLGAMWLVYWGDYLFPAKFYQYGLLPRSVEGIKGILFMPLIHDDHDFKHIFNNSLPIYFLLAALIYFYREIALKVFLFGWLATGVLLWLYAENKGAYHIGMSGMIYLLAAFLFTSGVIRKFLPLQAISLFVAFLYGSMIWGIFPLEIKVSWQGHFIGFSVGIIFAFIFKKHGPQRPKYQYEIEQEMGIEPPDLEGMYYERIRMAELARLEKERQENGHVIIYHYTPTIPENKPSDESQQ